MNKQKLPGVYLITVGDYSDYRVKAAYQSEREAKKHIKRLEKSEYYSAGDAQIEFYPFEDDARVVQIRQTTARWRVEMALNGTVLRAYNSTGAHDDIGWLTAPANCGWAPAGYFYCYAVAKDADHITKIGSEQLAQWLLSAGGQRVAETEKRIKRRTP